MVSAESSLGPATAGGLPEAVAAAVRPSLVLQEADEDESTTDGVQASLGSEVGLVVLATTPVLPAGVVVP